MASQDPGAHAGHYRVAGPACRITRLPVGRAEGILRLAFVVAGLAAVEEPRNLRRVGVRTPDGREPTLLSTTATAFEQLLTIEMTLGPAAGGSGGTYDALVISYDTGQATAVVERLDLTALGA